MFLSNNFFDYPQVLENNKENRLLLGPRWASSCDHLYLTPLRKDIFDLLIFWSTYVFVQKWETKKSNPTMGLRDSQLNCVANLTNHS